MDALDAMFVLCRVHYEAGHWHKLKIVCTTLWETWRGQHHGHHKFTDDFIGVLYLRYRYVLVHHEVCEYSILRQLTIEYRKTCIKVFGGAVAITIKASIELAQICMKSETHIHEAITIYEEILTTTKTMTTTNTTTSTTTSVVSSSTITKIKETLTKAYVSVCKHGSVSTTIIERAIVMITERFEFLKISFGWAHIEILTCLRELVLLQLKLKKEESHTIVIRILTETCVEIIKKKTHSKSLHGAAKFLGDIYISCGFNEQGRTLIEDIRIQIITGTSRHNSSFKFDKSVGKISYVFLVTFEQIIRGQVVGYSEIMAELLTETILYESYHRRISSEVEVSVVIIHAARLRAFLLSHGRVTQREILERESFEFFAKKWQSIVKSRGEITRTFYIGLPGELGGEARDVQIGNAACVSSIATVKHLLNKGHIQEAYEVASCALEFINHLRSFHLLQNIPYGFKLSALMVGRAPETPLKVDINAKLRENMLELSRRIIREVLRACKDSNINFVRMRLRELNDLAGLLGEQQNFADLEVSTKTPCPPSFCHTNLTHQWLLDLLWSSREVQKKWATTTIINIGRRFVEARYLNKDRRSRAIRLCEDICYNLRGVHGGLYPEALEMSTLLSELYTSMGHYREAQGVHESILRLVVEGDDDDDRTTDTLPATDARKHIDLLKQSYLRLKGWDKSPSTYHSLIAALKDLYKGKPEFKDVSNIDKWDCNKESPSETLGVFAAPMEWEFAKAGELNEEGDAVEVKGLRRPGMGVKRATSNWGISEVMRVLHGVEGSPKEDPRRIYNKTGILDAKNPVAETKTIDEEDGFESAEEGTIVNGHGDGVKA